MGETKSDTADLTDPDLFISGRHHDVFRELRRDDPVHWTEERSGPGFWSLTRYADVQFANRDNVLFSSAVHGVNLPDIDDYASGGTSPIRQMMLMMDPPQHTRYRLMVNRGFTPRVIARLEEHLTAKARAIVDDVIARADADNGQGRCDVVGDIAADLPLQAIAELVGVPLEERRQIFEWSNALVGADDPEYGSRDGTMEASAQMYAYALQLREQRRSEPRDDIVTALLGAEVDGHTLSDDEFAMFFLLLCVAGNETTRNATAHGVRALIEHPEQLDRLRADLSLLPTAADEIVRWASPIHYFRRTATDDVEVGGRTIRSGDKVVLWYVSANRDEDAFVDPFRFDVGRTPNDHVGFGAGGPHFCLGANLARMELRLIFREIVTRLDDLALDGEPELLRSNFVHGLKRLPVRFRPKADGISA
jgi:cholest-4-en-3-one 26-monooxygenase